MSNLTFLGAARTVTGSKYLLQHGASTVLVDCGLFQGLKELRLRNWEPLLAAPDAIHAVVLTHAHLDHVGYLPRLVAQGLPGPDLLHRRHRRPVPARTAGFGSNSGRGRAPAARVAKIDSMSAHADRGEIARWLGTLPRRPRRLCLVHGEPVPMNALRTLVRERFGWDAHMPAHGERLDI